MHASRSANMAKPRGHLVADDCGHAGRVDERPGTRRALWRRYAEALVDQQHDADVCGLFRGSDHLGALRLQDGLRLTVPWVVAPWLLRELHREAGAGTEPQGAAGAEQHTPDRQPGVPEIDACLLPVRVRRDHADTDAGLSAR